MTPLQCTMHRRVWPPHARMAVLLADTELLNEVRVLRDVLALQIIEQPAALADQLQEASTRMMVLRVGLEMFGEIADALAEDGDLDFGRPCVGAVGAIAADDFGLAVFGKHVIPAPSRAAQ